jgi:hypothetical protein
MTLLTLHHLEWVYRRAKRDWLRKEKEGDKSYWVPHSDAFNPLSNPKRIPEDGHLSVEMFPGQPDHTLGSAHLYQLNKTRDPQTSFAGTVCVEHKHFTSRKNNFVVSKPIRGEEGKENPYHCNADFRQYGYIVQGAQVGPKWVASKANEAQWLEYVDILKHLAKQAKFVEYVLFDLPAPL